MKNKVYFICAIVITISLIISLYFLLHFPRPYIAILTDPVGMNCNLIFHEGDFSKYPVLEKAIHEEIIHPNIHSLYDLTIFESQNYERFLTEQFDLNSTSGKMMGNTLCFNYVDDGGILHRLAVTMGDKTNDVDFIG